MSLYCHFYSWLLFAFAFALSSSAYFPLFSTCFCSHISSFPTSMCSAIPFHPVSSLDSQIWEEIELVSVDVNRFLRQGIFQECYRKLHLLGSCSKTPPALSRYVAAPGHTTMTCLIQRQRVYLRTGSA